MSTRRDFLQTLALTSGLGAMAGTLAGCGGDDDGGGGGGDAGTGGGDGGGGGACTPGTPTISANHGHTLSVAAADVEAGSEQTYGIQGSSGHPHTVTITAADFTRLRDMGSVTVTSSTDAGHSHMVTITCA